MFIHIVEALRLRCDASGGGCFFFYLIHRLIYFHPFSHLFSFLAGGRVSAMASHNFQHRKANSESLGLYKVMTFFFLLLAPYTSQLVFALLARFFHRTLLFSTGFSQLTIILPILASVIPLFWVSYFHTLNFLMHFYLFLSDQWKIW